MPEKEPLHRNSWELYKHKKDCKQTTVLYDNMIVKDSPLVALMCVMAQPDRHDQR